MWMGMSILQLAAVISGTLTAGCTVDGFRKYLKKKNDPDGQGSGGMRSFVAAFVFIWIFLFTLAASV